jgi:hypothetical protein
VNANTKEDTMDTTEKLEAIRDALIAAGYGARIWTAGDHARVYVTRRLSRRTQDMGYVAIESDGTLNPNGMQRQRAGVRDIAEAAIA